MVDDDDAEKMILFFFEFILETIMCNSVSVEMKKEAKKKKL